MRRLLLLPLLASALVLTAALGDTLTAQEPTPAGRLGGGAPLDATIPVATVAPTATPDPDASPTADAAPVASPIASPVAGSPLAPVACAAAPRSLDDVADLLMLTDPPAAPPAPTAEAWTRDARAEAVAVVAELVACGNDGRQLAAYALLTDAYLVDYLIGTHPNLSTIRSLFFDEAPALIPATITGLETRPADPGVVYLFLDLGAGRSVTAILTLAEDAGAYRVTAIQIAEPTG